MKGFQMKEITLVQFGEVIGERSRCLRVQVPDDLDTAALEYDLCSLVEELANEDGVSWEDDQDCTTFANRCVIWDDFDPEEWTSTPVLMMSSEMVAEAMKDSSTSAVEPTDRQEVGDAN
jgi:hypothetical protein